MIISKEELIKEIGDEDLYICTGDEWGDCGKDPISKTEVLSGMYDILVQWFKEAQDAEVNEDNKMDDKYFCEWVNDDFFFNFDLVNELSI